MSIDRLPPKVAKAQAELQQHYFQACAEVVYSTPEQEHLGALRLNVLVLSPDGRIGVKQLAQMQRAVQMRFFERMGNLNPKVEDVVTMALIPLGIFTPEEFNRRPESLGLGGDAKPN